MYHTGICARAQLAESEGIHGLDEKRHAAIPPPASARRTSLNALVVSQFISDPDLGVPDHQAPRVRLDRPACRGHPVRLGRPVCRGHPVRLDRQVRLARPVHPVRPGPRVQGRQGQVPQARGDDVRRWTVRMQLTPWSEASLGPASRVAPDEEGRTTLEAPIEPVLREPPVEIPLPPSNQPVAVDHYDLMIQLMCWRASPARPSPMISLSSGQRTHLPSS